MFSFAEPEPKSGVFHNRNFCVFPQKCLIGNQGSKSFFSNISVSTVLFFEKKCRAGGYEDAWGFAEDMRLVWENAKTYNRPGSGIYLVAEVSDC